jgi:hypothetical protein
MSIRVHAAVAAALALATAATSAGASTITRTFTFSVSGFVDGNGVLTPPVDPVQGKVTVTWDPAVDVVGVTSGITLDSLNLALGSPISYDYETFSGVLTIGGTQDNEGVGDGTDDFNMIIKHAPSIAPTLYSFLYSQSPDVTYFVNTVDSVKTVSVPLPEPATWVSLILGFGALGGVARRRRAEALGL